MIISHKYKFIFLKTNKTAGTSIEIALSKFCEESDIITPISSKDELTRQELGYRGPQNHLSSIVDYGIKDILRFLYERKKKCQFYNHISASEAKAHLGDEIWNSYFKFCFERNPWDRIISLYYYMHNEESSLSVSDFVKSKSPQILKKSGYDLYTIDGKIAVDKIYRFEKLNEELEDVCERLGLPGKLELPRAKSHYRKDKRSYQEILNEEDRYEISKIFDDEINLMGYEW
jgi:hypothetical protein